MTGFKYDQNKPKLTMVAPDFIEDMAYALESGEKKYGKDNWKQDLGYSRVLDAARRHIAALERGEELDSESGLSHAVHAACSLMYIHYYQHHGGYDDRRFKQGVPQMREDTDNAEHRTQPDPEVRLGMQPMRERPGEREHPPEASLDGLTRRVIEWADRVYPHRTPYAALTKMIVEEVPELLHGGLEDPEEYADVLIMLVDLAHLQGFDIVEAAHRKMDRNERRNWAIDPDTGLLNHTDEGTASSDINADYDQPTLDYDLDPDYRSRWHKVAQMNRLK